MHQFLLYSCYIELLMQVRLFKFASHALAKLKFYLIPHLRVILFYEKCLRSGLNVAFYMRRIKHLS